MTKKNRLSKSMTLNQFDNGYWYIDEIKDFAKKIGIKSASKLRKDQLERLIRHFIQKGELKNETGKIRSTSGLKDSDQGLSLKLAIINYTNNRERQKILFYGRP